MAQARAFLREMPGGAFFDDPAELTAAMNKAGCSQVVWNGGDGPENTLGNQLAARFGS